MFYGEKLSALSPVPNLEVQISVFMTPGDSVPVVPLGTGQLGTSGVSLPVRTLFLSP